MAGEPVAPPTVATPTVAPTAPPPVVAINGPLEFVPEIKLQMGLWGRHRHGPFAQWRDACNRLARPDHQSSGIQPPEKFLRTLAGHLDRVTTLVFSADGKILASGALDNQTNLWDVQTGKLKHALDRGGQPAGLGFAAGQSFATVSWTNGVRLWGAFR